MKPLFVAFLSLLSTGVYAQLDFGLKGGMSSSNVVFSDLESNANIENLSANNALGWHAGVYTRVKILGLYIQPEVIYSSLNSKVQIEESNGTSSTKSFQLTRLDVPVLLGIKFGPASIIGGPVMSYNLSHPSDIIEVDYRSGSLGYQAGFGLTLGNFIIDLKYEGSLQNLAEKVVIDGQEYDVDARTGQLILSLGYALF
ncbi:MAG: PorT family protein [Bacteroidetes bacterium]|uniref:PorT family protein n=1 Tax=Phaeocystidibacter marisrubri TaxID=1577780 RepID=A0A6L3ZG30_9FLAO|nr:outer membrane beta-barrel protein [Phaeocystidibacter marisrubri]KAB2817002.1 PorT family protein [Phaeocystidibacter marisrubri]TNE31446.1 MAG: PorT family protein [Bacteroidota bacterium]GGH77255.1 hypothetical protein GCM10011318_26750 [Phaeocystidibacter marisrubri]